MADDPFADYQNMMGMQGLFGQNPYLEYQGKIPMAGYYGTPTNAQGQPIQSYLDWQRANPSGTTINNTPAQPQATPSNVQNWQYQNSLLNSMGQGLGQNTVGPQAGNIVSLRAQNNALYGGPYYNQAAYNLLKSNPNATVQDLQGVQPSWAQGTPYQAKMGNAGTPVSGQQSGAGSGSTSYGPTPEQQRQAYLDALSNPGQVTTPSAQIYPGAAQTGAPQPSVLNQFLAAHVGGGTTGAGGYTNVPFFNTLNALKAGGAR